MNKENNWMVQQLRLSIFPLIGSFDVNKDLWPKLDRVDNEKQTIDTKTDSKIYEGSFKSFRVILTVTPVKIDLILSVAFPMHIENGTTVMDYLGDFSKGLKEFQSIVDTWFKSDSFPEITRLAFGAQLVKEMPSVGESYKHLSQYIPFEIDSTKMSDFNLQLNLFTKSKQIKDLRLNRISKWSSIKIIPDLSLIGNPKVVRKYPEINLSHLELDINTNQDNIDNIDKKILLPLYAELVSLGAEISEKGVLNNAN